MPHAFAFDFTWVNTAMFIGGENHVDRGHFCRRGAFEDLKLTPSQKTTEATETKYCLEQFFCAALDADYVVLSN